MSWDSGLALCKRTWHFVTKLQRSKALRRKQPSLPPAGATNTAERLTRSCRTGPPGPHAFAAIHPPPSPARPGSFLQPPQAALPGPRVERGNRPDWPCASGQPSPRWPRGPLRACVWPRREPSDALCRAPSPLAVDGCLSRRDCGPPGQPGGSQDPRHKRALAGPGRPASLAQGSGASPSGRRERAVWGGGPSKKSAHPGRPDHECRAQRFPEEVYSRDLVSCLSCPLKIPGRGPRAARAVLARRAARGARPGALSMSAACCCSSLPGRVLLAGARLLPPPAQIEVACPRPPPSAKSPVPTPERKASLVAAKSHNIKPSSSHISFGSLAEAPARADNLSSSPANPPTLSQRDGPPVFGSVVADPSKKPLKSSSLVTDSKPTTAPPSTKPEKKKIIDFQGPSPMSQPSQHHHQYAGHWQNGPAPNSPHFVPGNPPMNANMPNYPVPNGANQSQYLPKPPPFQHRNGHGAGQSGGGSSSSMYPPPGGRSNLHHQPRNPNPGPPSPRLPPSNAPNGGQSPNYQHASNSQGMPPPYWPQAPYSQNAPGPYPPYGYNPNSMPTYPHPTNFTPPQHPQHHSPQLSTQPGPPSPHTPNAAAPAFLPRRSAAVPIKKPVTPIPESPEKSADQPPAKPLEPAAAAAKKPALAPSKVKPDPAQAKLASEAAAKKAADEAAEKSARLAKLAKEKAEQEAKEKAEKEAKEKAEQEAKEKAAKEAKEKQEELERAAKKEREEKEAADKLAKEAKAKAEAKTVEPKPVNGASSVPAAGAKVRPAPIDVNAPPQSKIAGETGTPSLPSALSSARKIEDLGKVSYPENIQSPRSELNADATPGKFRYDRAFLLQFMEVCKGKPVQLPDLDSIGMVDAHNAGMNPMSRTQSTGGQRRNGGQMAAGNRGPSGSLTPSGGNMSMMGPAGLGSRAGPGGMAMFNSGATRSSEERFNQSNRPSMGAMPIGMGIMLPGRPTGQMSRSPSTNALPGIMSNGARDTSRRSGRGSRRDGAPSHPPSSSANNPNLNRGMSMQQMFQVEAVQPLQPSANSWAATRATVLEEDSPELVNRKVKALLNKLTLDKFESISDQVIAWANKSEKEHDGRILRQVIALIFEKATDEAHWSEMYAKLCRKLMEKLSPGVKDESLVDVTGNKVHGGQLFRKYLLNRCQEDYERGWSKRDELAAAAAGKAADDAVKQAANEKSRAEAEAQGKEGPTKEAEILSDEYYAAQKAKRQGLGLVRFIGELFKLNMLTERIMHECIKKLLSNIDTPEEEDIESLSRLMMTVGGLLDHEKAISHMNDVIDTRNNKWVGRNVAAGPKLISQIHEEAAQAAAEQSRQAQQASNKNKMNDLSRGGSRAGRNRDQPGGDGWSAVGGPSAPPPRPSKAGDLTQFGKLRDTSSSARASFGPSNVFANKGKLKDAKLAPEPAVAVAPNPFAALGADAPQEGSGPGLSRKPSASVDEFFHLRSVPEALASLAALPATRRPLLVQRLLEAAVERKEQDVRLAAGLFQTLVSDALVPPNALVKAFAPLVEMLDDTAVDVRFAYEFTGLLAKAAGLALADVQALAKTIEADDRETAAARLVGCFRDAVLD
ncbi:hypothetical protein PtA15_5A689 [Puccinia triticina]|uniref:MI domain-containing protein n=1 Tax=Puccinia triticina TaxID=208348 RepID=A0ABY7CMU6_9BASI|nr:uncharacterized protein PtA15_5A689 [Puccinia triticina]WAQ85115.1 hypothetical protein PtA15_5A689 [Puccinia triticina]